MSGCSQPASWPRPEDDLLGAIETPGAFAVAHTARAAVIYRFQTLPRRLLVQLRGTPESPASASDGLGQTLRNY